MEPNSDVPQRVAAQISWTGQRSCRGSVLVLSDGRVHFTLHPGHTLDGCPVRGAILSIFWRVGPPDECRILEMEQAVAGTVHYLTIIPLPRWPEFED